MLLEALLALLLSGGPQVHPEVLGPYTGTTNFTVDLVGEPDTRPGTWGTAGAVTWPLEFFPPPGFITRVLRLTCDQVVWPTASGFGPAEIPSGTYMGTLASILTTPIQGVHAPSLLDPSQTVPPHGMYTPFYRPEGSVRANYLADEALFYLQSGTNGPVVRVGETINLEGVTNTLLPDNTLYFTQAVYLNDTGLAAHMEVTCSQIKYQFEPQ